MEITAGKVATVCVVLGFIASLTATVVTWIRYGSPLIEDTPFFMQPPFFAGFMLLFIMIGIVACKGKYDKSK